MQAQWLAIITTCAYGVAAGEQVLRLSGRLAPQRIGLWFFGLVACLLHGGMLLYWTRLFPAAHYSYFYLFSLVSWLVASLLVITSLAKPVESLAVMVFPLTILLLNLAVWLPGQDMIVAGNPCEFMHILLSLLTLSVLLLAGVQAVLLSLQHILLRVKQPNGIVRYLPPIETMETLLFEFVSLGFVLLTVVLISSFIIFDDVFSISLIHKTLLSIFSWGVFFILLGGRICGGWRGVQAARWTLCGVLCVLLCGIILAL